MAEQKGFFRKEQPPPLQQNPEIAQRIRMLEERYSSVTNRLQLVEQNTLASQRKAHADIKAILEELTDIKKGMNDLQEKFLLLVRELQATAKKEELDVLAKYISYWEPLNFVTRSEVEKIVQEAVESTKFIYAQKRE
ncbi:MAG TPA: hypothetical protein VJC16_03290 [Candidatus Nanoarchaeia archaeon]|nr:hypothetical protein [Candidatus Nanoarchaeia archaeon]